MKGSGLNRTCAVHTRKLPMKRVVRCFSSTEDKEAPVRQQQGPPFKGTYSKKQPSSSQSESEVYPLTALHNCDPLSWPSKASREALYSTVPAERVEGLHVKITGHLPSWLRGSLYRNGPGRFEGAHAVFDGCAMIVRFSIDGANQSVVVSHRFLDTTYSKAAAASRGGNIKFRLAHRPISQGGGRGALGRVQYLASLGAASLQFGTHLGDNALVSIFPQGKELIAHTETLSGTYRVDPHTLETLGRVEYKDDVSGMVKTAHPSLHPSGDIYNISCDFMPVLDKHGKHLRPPHITLYRHPAQGDINVREKVASVPYLRPRSPTWIHQAPVTENYAIIVQNPVFYDIESMLFGESNDTLVFKWQPEAGSLIHIISLPKNTNNDDKDNNTKPKIRTLRAPAFLATHWVNAFESDCGRYIHLDVCCTDDPHIMSHWALNTVRSGPVAGKQIERSLLRRITIDLENSPDGSFLNQRPLLKPLAAPDDDAYGQAFELPGINTSFACKRHRYVYGACCDRPSNAWNALCKVDLETGEVKTWKEPGAVCWEPIFAGRVINEKQQPDSKDNTKNVSRASEDDGVVLSVIMQRDGRSALLVLDAASFKEVARAVLPYGLPNGFHSCWVPD